MEMAIQEPHLFTVTRQIPPVESRWGVKESGRCSGGRRQTGSGQWRSSVGHSRSVWAERACKWPIVLVFRYSIMYE